MINKLHILTMVCLLPLLAMLMMPAPVRAQDEFLGGSFDSHSPTTIAANVATQVNVVVRNTGSLATYFRVELDTIPGGWSVTNQTTGDVWIGKNRTATFRLQVTPTYTGTNPVKLKLFGQDVFGDERLIRTGTFNLTVIEPPSRFELVSPQPNQTVDGQFFVSWSRADWADNYDMRIRKWEGGFAVNPPVVEILNTQTSTHAFNTSNFVKGATYEVTVTAKNVVGTREFDDSPRRFNIVAASTVGPFAIVSPTLNQRTLPNPTFTWNAASGAITYELYIFPELNGVPNTAQPIRSFTGIGGTTLTLPAPGLAQKTPYYVSVIARGEAEQRPNAQGPVRFFVDYVPILGTFRTAQPTTDDTRVSLNPEFRWGISENATGYEFRLEELRGTARTQIALAYIPQSDGFVSHLLPDIVQLLPDREYAWNVFAYRQEGGTLTEFRENSAGIQFFRTSAMNSFTLLSPEPGSKNATTQPRFEWQTTPSATAYVVEVAPAGTDGKPNLSRLLSSPAVVNNNWQSTFTPLTRGGDYFWRVLASDGRQTRENNGGWQKFRVSPLTSFALLTPTNGATNRETQPIFSWQPVPAATGFRLYIQRVGGSFLPVVNIPAGRTAVDLLDARITLNGETSYLWNIEAISEGGTLLGNEAFFFSTRRRDSVGQCDLLQHLTGVQALTAYERSLIGQIGNTPLDCSLYILNLPFDGGCGR